jgi:hypothetical protein
LGFELAKELAVRTGDGMIAPAPIPFNFLHRPEK